MTIYLCSSFVPCRADSNGTVVDCCGWDCPFHIFSISCDLGKNIVTVALKRCRFIFCPCRLSSARHQLLPVGTYAPSPALRSLDFPPIIYYAYAKLSAVIRFPASYILPLILILCYRLLQTLILLSISYAKISP